MTVRVNAGILGGTFNPVHHGHVDLGLTIREAFGLAKILYILSARPPHKKDMELAPAPLRWRMLNLALEPYPQLEPCDIEMKRPLDSWTIDTIRELMKRHPDHHYYFISGSEGFLKIGTWKEYQTLLRMISFVVVLRKPGHRQQVEEMLAREGITISGGFDPNRTPAAEDTRVYLYTYTSQTLYLSSTLIRRKVKSSESIDGMVHPGVKRIMEENELYEK